MYKIIYFRWWNVFDDMVLVWRKSIPFDEDMHEKNDFYIFVPSDLDF